MNFRNYLIENNNNNSDFDANKETHKLHGLNEMTINQMNVDFADQLQEEEEQFMKEHPGEESIYNILRMPHSEELVSLTQSFGHETSQSESLFTHIDTTTNYNNNSNSNNNMDNIELITNSEDSDNSSSYNAISPASPFPTERDCIAISKLHNHKYMDDNSNSMQDEETSYRIDFSPEHSPMCSSNSTIEDDSLNLEEILKQLESSQQTLNQNQKRNSDHLSNSHMKMMGAKKSRFNIPIGRLVTNSGYEDGLVKIPDTPEVCDMVDSWLTEDTDTNIYSYSSSPSATSFADPEYTQIYTAFEPKFENPPSIASSYICDEPSSYATPSPSSSCTHYSTNPNSPAVSAYGSVSSRKPRGRPPKQHSDLPDPEIARKLSETDRKSYIDRCKNNEASRQSRQKNKEKQMSLLAAEECEQRKNDELKNKKKAVDRIRSKLEKRLFRTFKQAST